MNPRALLGWSLLALGGVAAAACGPADPPTDQRGWTDDFEIRIHADVVPPRAEEPTHYTVTVKDKKTRQPVVNGQGRIFATNSDRHTIWDGFTYGPEVGTYHATLTFLTAGEWAMGVQFRADSTKPLQRTLDWRQMIRVGLEPGEQETKP
ncbi:MAG: hypothetical protein HYR75_06100 [Gemmatimonadetes bacterium]|nr:hypothetical protein [Gemmatimonadota bacterium]MBI3566939.1 hypothetical protein [Gemmatimonadota bacterium]